MKTFATLPCLVIALTLLGSACSGDEGVSSGDADGACVEACDEGPSLLDALPPTTVISTLNKDQLVAFCEFRKAFHSDFLDLQTDPSLNCTAQGLDLIFQEGADIATCEAEREACIQAAGEQPSFELLQCLSFQVSSTQMQGCQVSLEEYSVCTDALLERAQALVDTLTCEITLEEAAVFQAQDGSALPPACDPIVESCPPLLEEFQASPD